MIIDEILNAKDGEWFDLKNMYDQAMFFGFFDLASAIDGGENKDIQRNLCKYIDSEEYNTELKYFINNFDWLKQQNKPIRVFAIAEEYVNEDFFKQPKQ